MAKVGIDWDELYPVFFTVDASPQAEIELSDSELARIAAAEEEWSEVQDLIRRRIDESGIRHAQW